MDWTKLGIDPIAGDNPGGRDMRYEPEFEALQAEIDKLASPTASSQVDWAKVCDTGAHILAQCSKDLTAASYMAVGLIRTRQVEGLALGIQVLADLLETHWEILFPPKKRMRGRAGALTWWMERSEIEFKNLQLKPVAVQLLQQMLDNIKRMDAVLSANMPEAPVLRPMQRLVEMIPALNPEPAVAQPQAPVVAQPPVSKPAEAPKTASAQSQSATATASEALKSVQDAERIIDSAFQKIRQASYFLLENDLKNPMAYRCRRMAAWATVDDLPPHTDGATQIPPPAPQVIEALQNLRQEGKWEGLIDNAEKKLSQTIFWFDLNRYVVEALTELGADHQKAAVAVCLETAMFFKRLPGLGMLTFSDGTAFADADTRRWLQGLQSGDALAAGALQAGPGDGATADGHFLKTAQEAKSLARKKNLLEAVGLLQQEMRRSYSRREHVQWRLAIIELLLGARKNQAVLPHVERVLADIEKYGLETWDPIFALEGLKTAWQGFAAQSGNEFKERADSLLQRIAGIDPVEALRLQK